MKMVALCGALCAAGVTHAGVFSEAESNNTIATANSVGVFNVPGGSVLVDGQVSGGGDVDWFQFTLTDTSTLSIFAAFSAQAADGVMQVVAAGNDVIGFDDDSGFGAMPSLQLENLAAGTYWVGLSGFGDAFSDSIDTNELFDGSGHGETFTYKLAIGFTVVPAPAPLALLGLGGLVAVRRRR